MSGFLSRPKGLYPPAFNKDITAIGALPSRSHPDGVLVRRQLPVTWLPDEPVTVPSLIPTDPHIAMSGRGRRMLRYSVRRFFMDQDLRLERSVTQSGTQQNDQ
jgi:hypothetical protein